VAVGIRELRKAGQVLSCPVLCAEPPQSLVPKRGGAAAAGRRLGLGGSCLDERSDIARAEPLCPLGGCHAGIRGLCVPAGSKPHCASLPSAATASSRRRMRLRCRSRSHNNKALVAGVFSLLPLLRVGLEGHHPLLHCYLYRITPIHTHTTVPAVVACLVERALPWLSTWPSRISWE
jgi:hypothetical protein